MEFLRFEGEIVYITSAEEAERYSSEILDDSPSTSTFTDECIKKSQEAVGFDLEWSVHFTPGSQEKVSLIQIAVCRDSGDKCFLFHLSAIGGITAGLKRVLNARKLLKVGVNIAGDLWKLERDYHHQVFHVIRNSARDISDYANVVLGCEENWSLDGLSRRLLSKCLNKEDQLRLNDWSCVPLPKSKQIYAATDAFASLKVYKVLEEREKNPPYLL